MNPLHLEAYEGHYFSSQSKPLSVRLIGCRRFKSSILRP